MAHKWKDIRRKGSPEAEARMQAKVTGELARLPLAELRRARRLTQMRMAELMEMDQGAISKIEHRTDMYIRTLRSYIEAMGGRLDLVAVFPDGEARIDHIGEETERNKLEA